MSKRGAGSRFLYEPFDATAARMETYEKVTQERWSGLERRLGQIEDTLERLEKRLWLAVFSVVSILLARGVLSVLDYQQG
ncbi:MAG: hypothetical protein COB84_07705 [Rhodobacteraceae bacterium]|nr:MAG: hypothetical protein COB84_07705 [Paracoccaceae bacterium]